MLNSLHSLAHCVQIRHFLREGLSPDPVPTIVCDTPAGGTAMAEGEVLLTQPGDAVEDTNSDNSDSDEPEAATLTDAMALTDVMAVPLPNVGVTDSGK